MTFNIRTATAPDGANGWQHRREQVTESIRSFLPDLLGLQECHQELQTLYLKEHLPEYSWLGVPRGGESESRLEMAPLLYRTSAFELLDSGSFWLSRTPETPSSLSWGASLPRTLTWARLKPMRGSRPLLFANTHFDHESDRARLASARLVRRFLENFVGDCSLALTGDFNALKDSPTYRHLTAPDGDGAAMLVDPCPDCPGTFHAFGALDPPIAIDWILLSGDLVVQQAGVLSESGSTFASDHNALGVVVHY